MMRWLHTSGLLITIGEQVLCRGLDLELRAGQCWGLLGQNGIGKSTLLHTLAGLRPAAAGSVYLQDQAIGRLSRTRVSRLLGLLLQDSTDPFPATVIETALLGRHPHLSRWQWEGENDFRIAQAALDSVGLGALKERRIDTLSGGERRRLALATLLTQQPSVMLLDEPTNHLDPAQQIRMLSLLTDGIATMASGRPGALLMSLHDINMAARFCSHLLLMLPQGEVISGPAAELLETAVLERLYGYPLMRIEHDAGVAFLPR
jgi:iron complex transport system ATP-binding protein